MLMHYDEQQQSLLQRERYKFFYDRWYKGVAGSKSFQELRRMAPVRMIRYDKTLQTSKSTAPPSVLQSPIGLLLPGPHPQATLSENISTGACFLYPAEQQTSMWFWKSHVYPSNPYQYSVTCMWISGPYLTQGTRSFWKRIPNVTLHKHALLLQQAWGLWAAPQSTNEFHESLSLGWYNSNPVCLCC